MSVQSSASPGIPPELPAAYGPAVEPAPPQRHGKGGRGQQPAPTQGASHKMSGKHMTMHSLASPGIPPEPPAAHGPLLGDDETARLPLPVSVLSPWAEKR